MMHETGLLEFLDQVRDQAAAERWLIAQRWPDGVRCPCGSARAHRMASRRLFQCRGCRRQFSVTSGTPMHATKLPLRTWACAIFLFATSSKGISARKLGHWLKVSYPTAWYLAHRIRAMMTHQHWLDGEVEIDEAYVGARRRKPGRGKGPGLVVVAVERGGNAVAQGIESHGRSDIEPVVRGCVKDTATVYTDGLPAYHWLGARRQMVTHSAGEFARGRVHVNTAEAFNNLFKRAIVGVYHWVSAKHAGRYGSESAGRWNRDGLRFDHRMTYRSLVA